MIRGRRPRLHQSRAGKSAACSEGSLRSWPDIRGFRGEAPGDGGLFLNAAVVAVGARELGIEVAARVFELKALGGKEIELGAVALR